MTQELIDYIRPLINGSSAPIMVDGLPRHLVIENKEHDFLSKDIQ